MEINAYSEIIITLIPRANPVIRHAEPLEIYVELILPITLLT